MKNSRIHSSVLSSSILISAIALVAFASACQAQPGVHEPGTVQDDHSKERRPLPTDADAAVELKEFHGGGISIKYPAGWELIKDVPEPRVMHVKTLGGKVNASMTVEEVPKDTTLDQYRDATTNDVIEEAKDIHPKKISEESTHVGDMPAWKIVYSITVPNSKPVESAKQTLYVAVKDGHGYILCCTAFDALPGKFDAIFRSMADSVKTLESAFDAGKPGG